MDKFKEEIDTLEILKMFNYGNLESLLSDVCQQKNHLVNPYSKALLHKLYKSLVEENAEPTQFLSKEEITFLNFSLKKDVKDLFEGIKEERERLILTALLDQD